METGPHTLCRIHMIQFGGDRPTCALEPRGFARARQVNAVFCFRSLFDQSFGLSWTECQQLGRARFGLPHGFPSTSEEAFGWIYLNPKHSPQNFLFFNQNLVTHKFLASQESLGSFAQYNIPIHLQNHKINRNYMFINYDRYILCYFILLGSELSGLR